MWLTSPESTDDADLGFESQQVLGPRERVGAQYLHRGFFVVESGSAGEPDSAHAARTIMWKIVYEPPT